MWQMMHFVTFRRVSLKLLWRGRQNAVATFSDDELQSSWQAQHFGNLHRHFVWPAQPFRRVASRALHSSLHTSNLTLRALHHTLCSRHLTLPTPHSKLYTPQFTLHALPFTLHALPFTLRTLLFALYTPHSTLIKVHLAL